jgi:hypothetical protein
MKRLLAFALAICAGWSGTASAQDVWGWSVITPTDTGTDQLSQHLRSQMQRPSTPVRSRRAIPAQREMLDAAPDAPAPDFAALRYIPSKARRTANMARFVSKTRASDPAGAKDLQNLFASGDIIEKIGGALAPRNLRVDNVADAYTVWWITAWQATRGRSDTTSDAVTEAVRAQSARALGSTAEFVQADDGAKQELAESLLVQAALIENAVDHAKGNPKLMRDIGVAVNKGAGGMGLDLTTMELTENGFVLGSVGAVANDGEKAASVDAQKRGGAGTRYGLIAAAAFGGVGIGSALWIGRRRG